MRLRSLVPALAVLTCLALTGCGGDDEPADGGSTSAAPSADAGSDGGADGADGDGASPGDLSDGCTLVSRELIQDTLGVDPGEGTTEPSAIAGPDTCTYAGIFASVQVTTDASTYLPESAFDPASVEGSKPAPDSVDRGYVSLGSFVLVTGDVGVFMLAADPQDSTVDQWVELAGAVADQLP